MWDCQHQHAYLDYSPSLTVGNVKIPTDLIPDDSIAVVQIRYVHVS